MLNNSFKALLSLWKWWLLILVFIILFILNNNVQELINHQQEEVKNLSKLLLSNQNKIEYYNKNLEKSAITKTDLATKAELTNFIKTSLENVSTIQVNNISLTVQNKQLAKIFFESQGKQFENISIISLQLSVYTTYPALLTLLEQFDKFNQLILYEQFYFEMKQYPNVQANLVFITPVLDIK